MNSTSKRSRRSKNQPEHYVEDDASSAAAKKQAPKKMRKKTTAPATPAPATQQHDHKKGGVKKEKGQMAKSGVDLALVSKEEAFEMAEDQKLSTRNYRFLGNEKRFNFGSRCVNAPGNNCNCASTGILNACIRASAMGALAAGAVPGVTCKLISQLI